MKAASCCVGQQQRCLRLNVDRRRGPRHACRAYAAVEVQQQVDDVEQIDKFGFREGFLYEFDRGPMIGAGTFGVVHVARHIKTGQKYAVKSIHKVFDGYHLDTAFAQRVFHEVDIARHMGQSLNVVHLVEAFEDDVCVDLVLELASGGDLWSRIQRGGTSEAQAARIITDVLRAVAQCHAKGVLLRDVKPENFLFISRRESSPLKMVDFGLAQFCRPGQTFSERAGTPYYIAPEVLQQEYAFPADVWSAGVTAYQLLTGRLPWANDPAWLSRVSGSSGVLAGYGSSAAMNLPGHGHGPALSSDVLWHAILHADLDFTWPPWDGISDAARDCVQSMLQRDPSLRPSAAELLHHPWLMEANTCRKCWSHPNSSSSSSAAACGSNGSSNGNGSGTVAGQPQQELPGVLQQQQQQQQGGVPLYLQPLEDSLVQRLQRYGTFSRLKQVSLRTMVACMSPQPQPPCLAVYAAQFSALDVSGTGRLPADSLVDLLSSDTWDLTDVEVRMLVSQFDLDHDGCVELTEWLAALIDWTQAQQHTGWDTWVQQVFRSFDADGDGVLGGQELLELLQGPAGHRGWSELDGRVDDVAPDVLQSVLRHADTNGDGQLCYDEFLAMLQTDEMDQLDLFPSRRCSDSSTRLTAAPAAAAAVLP